VWSLAIELVRPIRAGDLGALQDQFVSHSLDHRDLSGFSGARVAMVGGGASALPVVSA
jgi:cation diffusion facilitator CzcD-associated flavoprotein CzcO